MTEREPGIHIPLSEKRPGRRCDENPTKPLLPLHTHKCNGYCHPSSGLIDENTGGGYIPVADRSASSLDGS